MDIKGTTQIYGIFGSPVRHTLSPKLHNAVFQKKGIDAVYVPFEVPGDGLVEALEAVRRLKIRGVNLTIPHKEKAFLYMDEVPEVIDRAVGAINTVSLKDGKLIGHNTDGPGFIEDLKETLQFLPKGKRVLLLGAGGAARSAAFYLVKEECGELFIHNRTPERAKGLEDYVKKYIPTAGVKSILSIDEISGGPLDLVVNATSCGLKEDDPFPVNPDVLSRTKHYYDMIYSSQKTRLFREAQTRKVKSANGLGMLIHQAFLSELIWFPGEERKSIFASLRETRRSC